MSPMSAALSKTALLLIDFQRAFFLSDELGRVWSNDQAVKTAAELLHATRQWNEKQKLFQGNSACTVDIIHVRHHSTSLNSPLHPSWFVTDDDDDGQQYYGIAPLPQLKEFEGEPVFVKNVNSAFIGTHLGEELRVREIRQLIVFGLTTDHCVSTSVRMAANLKVLDSSDGKKQGRIILVQDACATFDRDGFDGELVHRIHVASLKDEFAEVMDTKDVLLHVLDI